MGKKTTKDFSKELPEEKRSNEELATDAENITFDNDDDRQTVAELVKRFEEACRQIAKPQTKADKLLKVWLKGKPYRVTPEKFARICPGGHDGPNEDEALKIVHE